MTKPLFLSLLLTTPAWAAPCGGARGDAWTNPDGAPGGFVAKTAKAEPGAIIAAGAQVCDSAQVKAGAKVLGNAKVAGRAQILRNGEVDGRAQVQGEARIGGGTAITKIYGDSLVEGGALVTGASQVYARSKVRGGAKVHNSVVCQASVIEGISVTDSDYYCQTEDPEPPMPAEALGKATLLGVDSDRDGVRDDVEIWINDRFSNIPEKDFLAWRIAFREIARLEHQLLRMLENREQLQRIGADILSLDGCTISVLNDPEQKVKHSQAMDQALLNTEERFMKHQLAISRIKWTLPPSGDLTNMCKKFPKLEALRKK